jgi:hypothetical protein
MVKLKDLLNEVISEADVFGNTTATDTNTSSGGESEEVLDDMFDDFEKDIKQADLDAPESEAIGLTAAGVALSFGEIQKLIGKFINLISKIPGFKKLSGDKLIQWGENNHHRVMKAFEWPLKKAGMTDAAKRKKVAEILHAVVVALLLFKGVGGMADKFAKGSTGMGYLKGALNAVKSNEIGTFIKKAFASV